MVNFSLTRTGCRGGAVHTGLINLLPCQGIIPGLAEPRIRTKPCGICASVRTAQLTDPWL